MIIFYLFQCSIIHVLCIVQLTFITLLSVVIYKQKPIRMSESCLQLHLVYKQLFFRTILDAPDDPRKMRVVFGTISYKPSSWTLSRCVSVQTALLQPQGVSTCCPGCCGVSCTPVFPQLTGYIR